MIEVGRNKMHNFLMFIGGIVLILVGLAALFNPSIIANWISLILGISISAIGVLRAISFFKNTYYYTQSGWNLFQGVVDVIFGVLLLIKPVIASVGIGLIVGLWTLEIGISKILTSTRFASSCPSITQWSLVSGILYLIVAMLIICNPTSGTAVVTVPVSLLITFTGVILTVDSFVM